MEKEKNKGQGQAETKHDHSGWWCNEHGVPGPVPQEVRVWIVDALPYAWTFHYLNVLPAPKGFPLSADDLQELRDLATRVGPAFRSRCIVADFARRRRGGWVFIEAGPGSCAGTAHEDVFKAVAAKLRGESLPVRDGAVGGKFGVEN